MRFDMARRKGDGKRMTPGESCDTCKAFAAISGHGSSECRRKAPTAVVIPGPKGLQIMAAYPPTQKDGWCCEWVPTKTETSKEWVTT